MNDRTLEIDRAGSDRYAVVYSKLGIFHTHPLRGMGYMYLCRTSNYQAQFSLFITHFGVHYSAFVHLEFVINSKNGC